MNNGLKITSLPLIIPVFVVITVGAYIFHINKQKESEMVEPERVSFNLAMYENKNKNWGYMIVKNGKIVIKQDVIPAISGNQTFLSKSDAERVGSLVLQKIKNGISPTIKIEELDSLGIRIKQNT